MKKYIRLGQFSLSCSVICAIFFSGPLVQAGGLTFSSDTFGDVDTYDLYRGEIILANSKKMIEGYPDGSFAPEQLVNRAEYMKMILLSANVEILLETNCFSDVHEEWFANYVCTAKKMGLIEGYSDGKFYPQETVNLAEASKVFSKAWNLEINTEESENWYEPYIKAIENLEVLPPTVTIFYEPLTRGESTKFLSYGLEGPQYSYSSGNEPSYDSIKDGKLKDLILQSWQGEDRVYLWDGAAAEYLGLDAAISPSEKWVAAINLDEENYYRLKIIDSISGEEMWANVFINDVLDTDLHFVWSNDGQKLALNSTDQDNAELDSLIYIFDLADTAKLHIHRNVYYECPNEEVESLGCWTKDLVWSANDEKMLILSQIQDEDTQETYTFTILSHEGAAIGEMEGTNPYPIQDYRWSEDGEGITYTYWDTQLNEKKEVSIDATYYEENSQISCTGPQYYLGYYTDDEADEADEWEEILERLYPSYTDQDIGGKCDMSNGDTLLSFAYSDGTAGAQQVILFDQELNVLKETTAAFIRKTSGGLTPPYLASKGENMEFIFRDGDGPCVADIRYKLDLETFEYSYSSITSTCY